MRLSYLSNPYKAEPTDGVAEPFEADLTGRCRGVPGKSRRLAPPQVAAAPSRSDYGMVCGGTL